jgi:peptide/nickel transport system permease protein
MTAPVTAAVPAAAREQTPWRRFLGDFFASKLATLGLVMLVLIVGAALLAPWIAPQNPYDLASLDIMDSKLKPGS